jgi:hypothetical protein
LERRHFLKLFPAAAPLSTAAALELKHNRAPAMCRNIANPAEAERMRAKMKDFVSSYDCAGMERRAHADYDLMLIPAGEMVPDFWSFFSEPIGSALRGVCPACGMRSIHQFVCKPMNYTNMYRANSFSPPETRHHERVLFIFSPDMDEADRNDLASGFFWEYRLADRVMARAPLLLARVMGDIADLVSLSTGQRKPVPIEAPYCAEFRKPVYIQPPEHFSLILRSDLATQSGNGVFVARKTIALYAFLDGSATKMVM